jgi:hypothetical protein
MSEPKKRHFFVGYWAITADGEKVVSSIMIDTFGVFPSIDSLADSIKPFYDNSDVEIISITELSETDYKQFYGEE